MAKNVGLALGGGGARGWAHIGVIRALEEQAVPINYIAGTSIGALVGAIYVQDKLHRLEQFAADINMRNLLSLLDIAFPGLGLIEGDQIREFLSEYLTDAKIEDCKTPFRCVATDFLLKKEVIFDTGVMVDAVRASISMPGVFVPCQHRNAYLVDGGVMNPVPVNVAKAMGADVVVAVNLNHDPNSAGSSSKAKPDKAQSDNSQPQKDASEPDDTSDQANTSTSEDFQGQDETGIVNKLVNRYENLKDILQDQVDDWVPDSETGMNVFDVIGNSINVMEQQVTMIRLKTDIPDVLIEPDLAEYGIFNFQQAQPMIRRGYEAAQGKMSEIKALLD
jgi:NTE family protein